MFGLEKRVILVTGGNRGIGAAIVAKLDELGAEVGYTYRSAPGAKGKLPIKADVTDPVDMERVAEESPQRHVNAGVRSAVPVKPQHQLPEQAGPNVGACLGRGPQGQGPGVD